ncbi:MAG: phage tail sheath C-terminal domain-containing protein, partial [Gammaproteobacteria bacterium]|nr:phage tail sheath C-terminal domain-containing protein [Gammaproteobacteria bacterium]
VAYLYALPDVSIVCLPDLPELVSMDRDELTVEAPEQDVPPEQFVECSDRQAVETPDDASKYVLAPQCDDQAYADWVKAIRLIIELLENTKSGRATQLVASLPLPQEGSDAAKDMNTYLSDKNYLEGSLYTNLNSICSAFVQLCYPWIVSEDSKLPQDLNAPEGVVAGLLARNALLRGSFRSISYLPLVEVNDLYPQLTNQQRELKYKNGDYMLIDRVSIFKRTAKGVRLISDVTTSDNSDYRQANISRIVSMLVRESRRIGESVVFETSGDVLWRAICDRMNGFLLFLYRSGALNGASAAQAYQVRCGRTTMTQDDIDNGRVIVEIIFNAASAIESIVVTLTLENSGQYVDVTTQAIEAA